MLNIHYSKGATSWKMTLLDHEELVQKLAEAAALAGWRLTRREQTDEQVSRLTFSRGKEHEEVSAYLGSLESRSNERGEREMYTEFHNAVPIRQVEGVKTLLIGYEYFSERFVGWDACRNVGGSTAVPHSLVVSEKSFSQAYPDGLAFYPRSRSETAVVFHPTMLMNYICNLEDFHGAVSEPEQDILTHISQEDGRVDTSETKSLPPERQIAVNAIANFWSETSFHARVLTAYKNQCAMCRGQSDFRVDVEAVHIVPLGHPDFDLATSNSLCLCALHHRAFDQGLVAVLPDYQIAINRTKLALLQSQSLSAGEDVFVKNLQMQISMPQQRSERPNVTLIRTALRVRELQHDALEPVPSVTG